MSAVRERPSPSPERPERGRMWRSRWSAVGAAVAVTLGAGAGIGLVSATSSPPSSFVSITPVRILDTRTDLGLAGPFVSATGRDLQVTGSVPTPAGPTEVVPPGATAVTLNVTVVQPTAAGFLSVRPQGTPGAPETSNLNFAAGDITPNSVSVALPASGAIEITYDAFGEVGPTTAVLVDVMGYFVEGEGTPGPQGPQGEAGPQGLQGPQGPAGPGALWARVSTSNTAATLQGGVGVTATTRLGVGYYRVTFDRDVVDCARVATLNGTSAGPFAGATNGFVVVERSDDLPVQDQRVIVRMYDDEGNATDGEFGLLEPTDGFHLIIICP